MFNRLQHRLPLAEGRVSFPECTSPSLTFHFLVSQTQKTAFLQEPYLKRLSAKLAAANGSLKDEKGIKKKDKEHFRTTLVNIVIPASSSANLAQALDLQSHEFDKDTMQRYYYYTSKGTGTPHVAEMEDEWLSNVLDLLSENLKSNHKITVLTTTCFNHANSARVLEEMNNILNSGEVPNLYPNEEKQELFEVMRNNAARMGEAIPAAMFQMFIDHCRELAHCYVYESSRRSIQKPGPAGRRLEIVATKFLSDLAIEDTIRPFVLRRHNYIIPTSYLELIKTFKSLLSLKQSAVLKLKYRYVNGLDKLNSAQVDLGNLQPQLLVTKDETDKILVQIERQSKEVMAMKKIVHADEAVANKTAKEAREMKMDCEPGLTEATPALESALAALDTLKSSDITVLKSMKSPPLGVKPVMETISIIKDVKAIESPDPAGSGKKIEDYWGPSKTLMSDMKFLDSLKAFGKDNINVNIMKQIRPKYMENPEFDPEKIKNATSATEGLCRWAESDLAAAMAKLNDKCAVLKQVEDRMAALEANFKAMCDKKEALEKKIVQ
ncbi:Dynein heavy chain 7, axonemal [Chytriomyces hyalinus]|nr:Dynein heavy chain 7, axonemal [Chytriomyces hyalinus]